MIAPTMPAVVLTMLVAACLLAGCGGSNDNAGGDVAGGACVVLANGSDLCGDEARAWCEGFASNTDRTTAEACGSVLPASSECAAYPPSAPAYLDCVQRTQEP